ncbi:MAG: metallophosphoesterase [Planctomycetes bacterium]|nr:metallophosphoesterase [Planctomycetota bacterium]
MFDVPPPIFVLAAERNDLPLWINVAIFVGFIAGHTELWVTFVNRVHALPLRCQTLRRLRHIHDLFVLMFPPALVWFVGLRGPALLVGGSWSNVPGGWRAYLAVCSLGFVGIVISTLRWQLRRPPAVLEESHSQTIDIAQRLGRRPIGEGPHRMLTHVPGNEIFRVEFTEQTFRLPSLPPQWDGLSILHVADTHFIGTVKREFFDALFEIVAGIEADLTVFTGDLLDKQPYLDWLPTTLGRLEAPLGRYFILGNHDWPLDVPAIRRRFAEHGWVDVAGKAVAIEHRGHTLVIAGTERPWMGEHPEFARPTVERQHSHRASGGRQPPDACEEAEPFRLLLSHTPDHLPWARRQHVDLMLSGHNHGGQVVLPIVGPVYSPSRYGVRYAGGAFHEPPTLLYVSRGISGRHPLRWNCQPEIARLILRSGSGPS